LADKCINRILFPRDALPGLVTTTSGVFLRRSVGCRKDENPDVRNRDVEPQAAAKKAKNIMVAAAGGRWRLGPAILNLPECESSAKSAAKEVEGPVAAFRFERARLQPCHKPAPKESKDQLRDEVALKFACLIRTVFRR
jgi:hypothetical protein